VNFCSLIKDKEQLNRLGSYQFARTTSFGSLYITVEVEGEKK
jgi:hypothetical protein